MSDRPTPETDAAIKEQSEWKLPFVSATMYGATYDGPVASFCRRMERERDEARRKLEDLDVAAIHSCHNECQRPMCVLRRERDEATDELRDIRLNLGAESEARYWKEECERVTTAHRWLMLECDKWRFTAESAQAIINTHLETINRWRKAAGWEETK